MAFFVYATPSKDGNQDDNGTSADNDGQASCENISSFAPLLSHVDSGNGDAGDNVSVYSDHTSDENNCVERAVAVDGAGAGPASPNNECLSVQSAQSVITAKSDATASTDSLSQILDAAQNGGATSVDVEQSITQQHPSTPTSGEYFEALPKEPVIVLGMDISHLSRRMQFVVCASGVVGFNLMYGYLQELISVEMMNRKLGLFLAVMQFTGYTIFSYILNTYVNYQKKQPRRDSAAASRNFVGATIAVPFITYLGLSMLRALDLGMTNMAMQYINYPAKTLMKSSRVVFTMLFGVLITRKKYFCMDYFVVMCMVAGLAIFMHADATSSAVFQPIGVIMLTVSLLCDGAISNVSESIMNNYGVGQDEFIFRMYSIALIAITVAAAAKGDLQIGLSWIMQPGNFDEVEQGVTAEETMWTASRKIGVIVLFSCMGFFGGSCSAAITKNFGALTMSITSTARKAMTLFLSFFLFNNICTMQHILGVVIFITALTAKSLRRSKPKDQRRRSGPGLPLHYGSPELAYQLESELDGAEMATPLALRGMNSYVAASPRNSRARPHRKSGTPVRLQNPSKFI